MLDASVTLPWLFPDEATPLPEGLLDARGARPPWALASSVLECANVLQSAQRRGRIDAARRAEIVEQLGALPVRADHEPLGFATIDRLAAAHALGAHEAACLELALRRSMTLASLDAGLLGAARKLGHPVLTAEPAASARLVSRGFLAGRAVDARQGSRGMAPATAARDRRADDPATSRRARRLRGRRCCSWGPGRGQGTRATDGMTPRRGLMPTARQEGDDHAGRGA